MSRMYSVQTSAVTLAEARDVWEVLAAAVKPVIIHGWSIFQTSDVKDAEEEILRLTATRGVGSVTSGSGGAAGTIHPLDDADAAAGATVETNNTTQMLVGTGTLEILEQFAWNIRIPWVHYYTPETRPLVKPSDRWVLGITAPADAVTFGSTLWFEEL